MKLMAPQAGKPTELTLSFFFFFFLQGGRDLGTCRGSGDLVFFFLHWQLASELLVPTLRCHFPGLVLPQGFSLSSLRPAGVSQPASRKPAIWDSEAQGSRFCSFFKLSKRQNGA